MSSKPSFYKLSAAELPDALFRKEAKANDWIGCDDDDKKRPWMETTTNPKGFPPKQLSRIVSIDKIVELERIIGIPMYMAANVSPVVVPLGTFLWLFFGLSWAKYLAIFVAAYHGILFSIWRIFFVPKFAQHNGLDPKDPYRSQYFFSERNVTKYCSTTYVWPASLQRPSLMTGQNKDRPVIYCVIPHGLAPLGISGYPYFSKVWNSKLCSWTCAPFLLTLPVLGHYFNVFGYIPAKSKHILETLTKKDRNVGIVLDGIDGMFHSNGKDETGAILGRKGICKIALKANVAIVPVYGFGNTKIYHVLVDPFGILQFLSAKLQMSLTPFVGRWGWFMGPPYREVPISMCLGDPIYPPENTNNSNGSSITQEEIDAHHQKLLDGFTKVFETHKTGYYGEKVAASKKLVFVK
mmetsp:Transcript_8210/g.20211  ORF Transcript_8210/g.20211 Transcript_8210/m.20211 type:complete len:408 (-) Transcript_8210:852-2075(-)